MATTRKRARQQLGTCPVTRLQELDEDADVTLRCVRVTGHTGYHQDPNFGRWI